MQKWAFYLTFPNKSKIIICISFVIKIIFITFVQNIDTRLRKYNKKRLII